MIPLILTLVSLRASPAPTVAFEGRKSEYVANAAGYRLSVTSAGAVLTLREHVVRMTAIGMGHKPTVEGIEKMPGKANYIVADTHRTFELFGGVRWRRVYTGIDIVFRGNQDHLEYDFEVASDRDPASIALAFEGVDEVRVEPGGDLILRAGTANIRQPRPVAYQLIGKRRQAVEVTYWIDDQGHVRLRTGGYDRRRMLIIDPEVIFDRKIGGSAQSAANGFARDRQGNLYLTGLTAAPDFPLVNPIETHLGTSALLATGDSGQTWVYPLLGGGRIVSAIAAAPSTPTTMYAATQAGIFRSVDAGSTWTATEGKGLSGVASTLAVDPRSAAAVYAGTPQGVFLTTDGGANWQALPLGTSVIGVPVIAIDPNDPATVYASIQNPTGFLRSTDSGQTWTRIPIGPPNQEPLVVAIGFGAKGTVLLGTTNGLITLTDGGANSTGGSSPPVYNNQALAVSPSDPRIVILAGPNGFVRSVDGGQTFSATLASGRSTTFGRVTFDPRNPSTVYAGDSSLYRSDDAGQTWSQVTLPYSLAINFLLVSRADGRLFVGSATGSSVFVTKFSPDGSRVLYSTFLGGSGSDAAYAIAVDAGGNAYITGSAGSTDFPTTSGAFRTKPNDHSDIFVSKLSPDGSKLVYSTLLGAGNAAPAAITVDAGGSAILTGRAQAGFPVTANAFQKEPVNGCDVTIPLQIVAPSGAAFVTRLSPAGDSLEYSTLLGGNCASYASSLALDGKGNVWVAGTTVSTNFPVTSDALQSKPAGGYYDGFLARFNAAGGLDYATYIGGPGYDSLTALTLDQAGNIFLAGESGGLNQPASAGAYQPQAKASCPFFSIGPAVYSLEGNGMVLKLDATGRSVLRLTYLGAPGCLIPNSIAVDSSGQPWIAGGFSGTATLPTAAPVQLTGNGFVSKFSADFTQLLFSSYFDSIAGMALDSSGSVYAGGTSSYDITTNSQPVYVGKIDATLTAIALDAVASAVPAAGPSNFRGIAAGEVIRLLGRNMGPATSTPGNIVDGVLATTLAGVQVTFDGTPAALLFASAGEIDLVTPFELAGKSSTTVQVQYNGAKSNAVLLSVDAIDPQILGVYNEDFTSNAASNPAQAGSIVTLYVAGIGQTDPPSENGRINSGTPARAPAVPLEVRWLIDNPNGMTSLPVTFAGAAPGLAAGIFQVNFVAPEKSISPLNLMVGSNFGPQFNVFVK